MGVGTTEVVSETTTAMADDAISLGLTASLLSKMNQNFTQILQNFFKSVITAYMIVIIWKQTTLTYHSFSSAK